MKQKPNYRRKDSKVKRQQPKKDSNSKRINYDNERVSRFERDLTHTDKDNDISWYAHNPELLRAAASLPFSNTTGTSIITDGAGFTSGNGNYVPGVLTLNFIPSFGGVSSEAIKLSADSIYSFVIHANSRNTSYNAVDQMLVILAATEVFAMIANGIRAYGVAKTFDQRSKYLPDGLLTAMGFDPMNIRQSLNRIWFDLNEIIASASQIWIPDTLPVVKRRFWMNSNIYMDSETVRGQYYIMNQQHYLAYNETQTSSGGGLSWIKPDGTMVKRSDSNTSAWLDMSPSVGSKPSVTWSQYVVALRSMINYLINSEDRGIIMGDFLKAYGTEHIFALKPIPVDYTVTPIYDREVLTQIENATLCSAEYFDVTQTNNTLAPYQYGYNLANGATDVSMQVPYYNILNFHQKEIPSPEQIMVATRLKAMGYRGIRIAANAGVLVAPRYVGTEQVTHMHVTTWNDTGIINWNIPQYFAATVGGSQPNIGVLTYSMWSSFDWAPWLYGIQATPVPTSGDLTTPSRNVIQLGDYDMYTTMSLNDIDKVHRTAIFSEYNVPTISI